MIIVTGTNGFIGRHFLTTLQDKDEDVLEVDQQGAWYFKSTSSHLLKLLLKDRKSVV